MAQKRKGSLTLARVDQWSMLGLGCADIKEGKDKWSHGKSEDKGKLSPRHVVRPPFSPRMGGVASGLVPAVGGIGGHMKLEPPPKFTRKGFATIQDWLEETTNWLELSSCTPNQ